MNQSSGLIMAINDRVKCTVLRVNANSHGVTWSKLLMGAFKPPADWEQPSLIIGAGSRTHPTILAAGRYFKVPTVLLMSPPKIIQSRFDLCVCPEHDRRSGSNIITTKGAINTIRPSRSQSAERGLFLIGGPSKHHSWHEALLIKQVQTILSSNPDMRWKLTTSRRTPETTLAALQALDHPALSIYPVDTTPQGWVADALAESGTAWVTEDSVSMVYEALSSGAHVGLLQVPRASENSRVLRGLDQLIQEGWVQAYDRGEACMNNLNTRPPLNEADRVAEIVVQRYLEKA